VDLSEAERIVKKRYPGAFAFPDWYDHWTICSGVKVVRTGRHIQLDGVGWHDTIQEAWVKAAEVVQREQGRE